jgi:hypothetical protein
MFTPLPTTQFQTKTKTASSSHKTKKSKSFDSSKVRRSNRIASGGSRRPVIDTTVYCIDDSEDTLSESPKTLSIPELKTYTRKISFEKSKPKSSKVVETSDEENLVDKHLKKPTPLIHDVHIESFDKFIKTKYVLPGRVYNFDDLMNTNHDLTKYTNPLGWTHLFNLKETHYPTLVQAFYFNAAISSEKNQIISEVKDKEIRITEELLGNLLKIPTKGNQVYGPSWFSMLDVDKSNLILDSLNLEPLSQKIHPHPNSNMTSRCFTTCACIPFFQGKEVKIK